MNFNSVLFYLSTRLCQCVKGSSMTWLACICSVGTIEVLEVYQNLPYLGFIMTWHRSLVFFIFKVSKNLHQKFNFGCNWFQALGPGLDWSEMKIFPDLYRSPPNAQWMFVQKGTFKSLFGGWVFCPSAHEMFLKSGRTCWCTFPPVWSSSLSVRVDART